MLLILVLIYRFVDDVLAFGVAWLADGKVIDKESLTRIGNKICKSVAELERCAEEATGYVFFNDVCINVLP